jgi:hypothetical protein
MIRFGHPTLDGVTDGLIGDTARLMALRAYRDECIDGALTDGVSLEAAAEFVCEALAATHAADRLARGTRR